ncbi:MAG TPA: hypothetical protein VMH24_06045, partial [Candidatus Sulfotelmatobacter sp.]|nr:hypothetical protein [Candidatus Sulfotelmatobacter sp.]
WQLRLLGGALGALCSGLVAIIGLPTSVIAFAGLVGIPAGTVVGFIAAPSVLTTRRRLRLLIVLAFAATLVGWVTIVLLTLAAESAGASMAALLMYGTLLALGWGLLSLIFGWPMALVVAVLAGSLFRRLASNAARLWVPSVVVLGLVAIAFYRLVASWSVAVGDEAARGYDRVPFDIVVSGQVDADYWLAYGSAYGADSIDPGNLNGSLIDGLGCSSTNDSVQGSDWALWVVPNPDGLSDTSGPPLVSSSTYGAHMPVRLRVTIAPDGTVRVADLGDAPATC